MFLYGIALILPKPCVAQARFIHSAPNSLPCIARILPLECSADRTLTNGIFKPFFDLMEVQPSRTRGRIASEVSRSCAREIVFMLGAYYIAYLISHSGKIRLRPRYKLIVLARPFAMRRFHQSPRLAGASILWVTMSLE